MADMLKISVCMDCIMLLANGEVCDGNGDDIADTVAAQIQGIWEDVRLIPGGDDLGFSWQDCQGCGTRLGGDRFEAFADTL